MASWLGVLQSCFIIYLLKPYHSNFNKRIVKTPKLYFYDTGILCSLLGITPAKQISTYSAKGAMFKNFILSELLKQIFNTGRADNLFFWRDKTGNEIDFLFDDSGKLTALELKSSQTISQDFFKGLNYFSSLTDKPVKNKLVYARKIEQKRSNGLIVLPWNKISDEKI